MHIKLPKLTLTYFEIELHVAYKNNHNSKWIKDLNIRPETIKLLEKNISGKLLNTDFRKLTPKAKAQKAEINTWDCCCC